jgi:hypothetical protein
MEIRLQIPDDFIYSLVEDMRMREGKETAVEIAREAFTLLRWAVDEVRKGRVILSGKPDASDARRLRMRSLEMVRPVEGGIDVPYTDPGPARIS